MGEHCFSKKTFTVKLKVFAIGGIIMYSALDVAKYTVSKCVSEQKPISNLQLQKILYYIQKEFLKIDKQAFDDNFEAWQFGPVIPTVYYRFCGFGAMPITSQYDDIVINNEDKEIIDNVIEKKRGRNPWDLVMDTHKTGGAWDQVYDHGEGLKKVIPISLIKGEK